MILATNLVPQQRRQGWLRKGQHQIAAKSTWAVFTVLMVMLPAPPLAHLLQHARTCSPLIIQRSSTYIEVFALVHGSNHFDRGFLAFDGRTEEAVKPRRKQPFNHLWTPIWLHPYPAISCTYQWSSYHVFLFCFFFSFGPSYQQKSRRFDIAMSINLKQKSLMISEQWRNNEKLPKETSYFLFLLVGSTHLVK